ncbi:MAG TPA: tetratricopeptide repeat protein [Blastocatellia bacterium]|nr:tetratricopeptide repeat protein [Blastocatellia bacterium]
MAFAFKKNRPIKTGPQAENIRPRSLLLNKTPLSTLNKFGLAAVILLPLFISPGAGAQNNTLIDRLEKAATLIRDKRIDEAERQLNSILKAAPKEPQALNLLGTIRASQGRLAEAEALFTRAISIDDKLVGAHMNLAYLYLLKGAPEKTIDELKRVLSLDANNTEALYKLSRLLLSHDRVDECIDFIEKSPQAEAVALLIVLGDAYLRKGDADRAEAKYLQAVVRQPAAADALLGLAQVSRMKEDVVGAQGYLSRAKGLAGNSPDLIYRFAMTALRIGFYDEARSSLEEAIKLWPGEPAYFLALGATWLKKPDLIEAEQAFRRALQLQPGSPQGQMYLGYTLLKQKKLAEARELLEKSLKSDPNIPESYYYLGLIAQEQNEDARAVEILETAARKFPSFANARVALGSAYMKLRNYPRAKEELELAVKLNPDEPKAHYNLAMLYARLKDPKRAQEQMRIVERLKNSAGQEKETDALTPSPPNPL